MNGDVTQEQMKAPSQVCDISSLTIKGINVVLISEEEELPYVSKTIKLCSAYEEFCNWISAK